MQFSTALLTSVLLLGAPVFGQQYGAYGTDSTSTTTISSTSTTYVTVTVLKPTSSAPCNTTSSYAPPSVVVPYPTGGSSAVNYTSIAGTATSYAIPSVTPVAPTAPNAPVAPISPGAGAKLGSSVALALAAAGFVGALAL